MRRCRRYSPASSTLYNLMRGIMSHRIMTCSLVLNLICSALFLGGWLGPNVETSFNPKISQPVLSSTTAVHPLASVIGSVELGQRVFVAPLCVDSRR